MTTMMTMMMTMMMTTLARMGIVICGCLLAGYTIAAIFQDPWSYLVCMGFGGLIAKPVGDWLDS